MLSVDVMIRSVLHLPSFAIAGQQRALHIRGSARIVGHIAFADALFSKLHRVRVHRP